MKTTYHFIVLGLSLAIQGCAELPTHAGISAASTPTINHEKAREYLNTLAIKKNRFLLQNGYDSSYVAFVNPSVPENNSAVALTPCDEIAHSQWANNLNNSTFDLFTRTMERCYGTRSNS